MAAYFIIATICGVSVALAELLSRYKDEPLKAISCWAAVAYIVFNAALSYVAFKILVVTGTISPTSAASDSLRNAVFAGFGAAIIMRAKVFNLKTDSGEQLSIGPDFVIDALLKALDRQIDRKRAYDRAKIVMQSMERIDYKAVRYPLITLMTKSMQGITDAEMKELGKTLDMDREQQLSDQDRAYALGFMVLNLAGDGFFKKVFSKDARTKYERPAEEANFGDL